MNTFVYACFQKSVTAISAAIFLVVFFFPGYLTAQAPATLTLQMDKQGAAVSRQLYGLMTEEINYSYDGGLYAELIRNRIFKDNPRNPDYWSVVNEADSKDSLTLDNTQPINDALTVCVLLNIQQAGKHAPL